MENLTSIPLWLPAVFFLVAFFYSMVGFGGGSSYLAILALIGLSYQSIPPIALVCNLIVVTGGCWHFYRAGYLKLNIVLPFVILSIPMAYWAGTLVISKQVFALLLGVSLLCVAVRMFLPNSSSKEKKVVSTKQAWLVGIPVGALLGFLAGLVGIGGGIFLSPLLLLMNWGNIKQAAATASFFIFANSLAGLLGQMQKGTPDFSFLLPLAIAVFIGGQLGSRFGAYKVPKVRLQQLLGIFVLYVGIRLIGIGT